MPKEIMHVAIEQPVEKRREVLSSAIDTIQMMKNYERLKQMQKEKDVYRKEFKNIIKEVSILVKELKEKLPKVEEKIQQIKKGPEQKAIAPAPKKPKEEKKVIEVHRRPDDKFEAEMKLLREKITKL